MSNRALRIPRRAFTARATTGLAALALAPGRRLTGAQRHHNLLDILAAIEQAQIAHLEAIISAFAGEALAAAMPFADMTNAVETILTVDRAHLEALQALGASLSTPIEPSESPDASTALTRVSDLKQLATAAYAGALGEVRGREIRQSLVGMYGAEARLAAYIALLAGQNPIPASIQQALQPEAAWSAVTEIMRGGTVAEGTAVAGVEPDSFLEAIAENLGVDVASLTVQTMEHRDWPDTSLGCPRPGEAYAEVITPGYLIVVELDGERIEYHTDQRGNVVRCP